MSYRNQNAHAWNRNVKQGSCFAKVATDEECVHPLKTLDSRGWLPKEGVAGWNILCLASGGGWQSILYASAGANVTVVDLSDEMLKLDRREAERRGLNIEIQRGTMEDLSFLDDATFDLVHQPVSSCYVPNLRPAYKEIARVLKSAGLYISQHKQPTSLQVTEKNREDRFVLGVEYYHEGPLPNCEDKSYRENGAVEFLHRWEEIVGELCHAGFVIEDLIEPKRADIKAKSHQFGYRGRFVPPYVRLKARRTSSHGNPTVPQKIWVPQSE